MIDEEGRLAPGARLAEFEIVRVLGAGGFGVTYLAWDRSLDCEAAGQGVLPARVRGAAGGRNGGAAVRQVFETAGSVYLVMERVEGRNLETELKAAGGVWPEARVRGLLAALTTGLETVHAAKMWHRDIKPSNVMVRPDKTPVLIDFGAARIAVGERSRSVAAMPAAVTSRCLRENCS